MLGPVSTWMGDRLGTLGAVGIFWLLHPFPPFSVLSGVIRKGSPSIKVWVVKYFCPNFSWRGSKWSRIDAPGTQNPQSHSVLKLAECPFSLYWPSGVIRIGLPSMKVEKFETFLNKRGSTCCKWPNWNTPGTQTPLYHPIPELTKPNLTTEQSSLPLQFASFHPLLSATAIPHWIHQFSSDHWS